MPIKRDADGNIIDQSSRYKSAVNDADQPTDRLEDRAGKEQQTPSKSDNNPYDAKTVLAGTVKSETREQAHKDDERRTRVYRPARPAASPSPAGTSSELQVAAMKDPPVGWLVVIGGPGQGNVLTLGNGTNSIGRNRSERLSLNFGDEMISRSGHATITYDPRGKKFYFQHGGGTNLSYVNDQPVLAPQELPANTHIMIGNTTLRFVPLCGEQFDWDTWEAS